jgi:RNA polymerase sigma-70 factor, ECF subfamily
MSVSVKQLLHIRTRRQEDAVLVLEAQRDSKKFSRLYIKYKDDVYKYVFFRVDRDKYVAEDIAQEVFYSAFKHLDGFRAGGASYLTYLRRIAHNRVVNYYRTKKLLHLDETIKSCLEVGNGCDEVAARDLSWYAMAKLSETEKEIITMKYGERMLVKEIADILQRSDNSVKLHLSRARKKLRRFLSD